jgi:hypothetical protein
MCLAPDTIVKSLAGGPGLSSPSFAPARQTEATPRGIATWWRDSSGILPVGQLGRSVALLLRRARHGRSSSPPHPPPPPNSRSLQLAPTHPTGIQANINGWPPPLPITRESSRASSWENWEWAAAMRRRGWNLWSWVIRVSSGVWPRRPATDFATWPMGCPNLWSSVTEGEKRDLPPWNNSPEMPQALGRRRWGSTGTLGRPIQGFLATASVPSSSEWSCEGHRVASLDPIDVRTVRLGALKGRASAEFLQSSVHHRVAAPWLKVSSAWTLVRFWTLWFTCWSALHSTNRRGKWSSGARLDGSTGDGLCRWGRPPLERDLLRSAIGGGRQPMNRRSRYQWPGLEDRANSTRAYLHRWILVQRLGLKRDIPLRLIKYGSSKSDLVVCVGYRFGVWEDLVWAFHLSSCGQQSPISLRPTLLQISPSTFQEPTRHPNIYTPRNYRTPSGFFRNYIGARFGINQG